MNTEEIFNTFGGTFNKKMDNFEKFVPRQAISRFLARYELFKMIKDVKGDIIECGVYHGGGVMAWAKLSTILEPYALYRNIIGFDTFEGFPNIHDEDASEWKNRNLKEKALNPNFDVKKELEELIKNYDDNRYLGNFPKIELVKGDAIKTIPEYVEKNPQLTISLLFLDFDLYNPTKIALKYLFPRVVKGGIVVFDEVNNKLWPGETKAIFEKFGGFNKLDIKKFNFEPKVAYMKV
jgi:hypothetical protein